MMNTKTTRQKMYVVLAIIILFSSIVAGVAGGATVWHSKGNSIVEGDLQVTGTVSGSNLTSGNNYVYSNLTGTPSGRGAYSYLIGVFPNSTYYAVNGTDNQYVVSWTSTNASNIVKLAYGNLTSGRAWYEKVLFTGNITFTNTVTLPSWSITQIDGKIYLASGSNCDIFTTADTSNIEVFGGLIDGNKASQSGTSRGFLLNRVTNVNIHDLHMINTLDDAILVSANGGTAKYIKITHCTFEGISDSSNYGTPIEADTNVYYLEFTNNILLNSGWAGSDLDGCYYSEYSDNVVIGAVHMVFEVSEGSSHVTIARNVFRNVTDLSAGTAAIRVGGAGASTYYIKIVDNIIDTSQRDGIFFDTQGSYFADVSGNIINNTGLWNVDGAKNGITIQNVYNSIFDRNTITESKGYGYYLKANVNNTRITGSFTVGNDQGCFNVTAATCGNNIITNNNFSEGDIVDAGTNTRAYLNFNPSTNAFITAINPPLSNTTSGALP